MGIASLSLSSLNAGRERIWSVIGVAAVHALIAYALLSGLAIRFVIPPSDELKTFDIVEEPPPPAEEPPRPSAPAPDGAAAPRNFEARPTEVVAPTPRIRLDVAQQVGAAPVAGSGAERSAGASPLPGPGTGAGGTGTGLGSGGAGTGPGGGGIATRARLIRGRIDDDDYPRGAYREQIGGTVVARLAIGPDGRVGRCSVTRSSGNAELDETTCRLIERRFRFEPARDAAGNVVPSETGWRQTWWLEPR